MFIKINTEVGPVWVNTNGIVTIDTHVGWDGWEIALVPHAKYSYISVYRERNPDFEDTLSMLALKGVNVRGTVHKSMVELAKGLKCQVSGNPKK